MHQTTDARVLLERLDGARPLNTEIRAIAKEQGKNHDLAVQLWKHGGFSSRMLSLLMLDLKQVESRYIGELISDVEGLDGKDQVQLCDWMIANVIMKKAALKKESARWRSARSPVKQRVFWSVQARSVRPENHTQNEALLEHIEKDMGTASEIVQWNMNWCAAQIGIADASLRERCVALGERLGLYQDYPVPRGCTSPYLPIWIGSVVDKKSGGA